MAVLYESWATLRIVGDSLVPGEISTLMGCEPTDSGAKGEVKAAKEHRRERRMKTGSWTLKAEVAVPGDLNDQTMEILGKLTQDMDAWRSLSSRYKIDLFCGLWMKESNEGLLLNPNTLRELGLRGIILDLSLYAPSRGDAE